MTTSTWPHAWHFLDECDVPVETQELPVSATFSKQNGGEALSADSCSLSDSATLGVQNDSPDPTYQGCLPSERYPSDECDISRSPDISCDRKDDATGCGEAAKLTDSVTCADERHTKSPIGAPNDNPDCNRHDAEPVATVDSCSECCAVTDIDYAPEQGAIPKRETRPVEETPDVPFAVQEFMFEALCEEKIAELPHLIFAHSGRIIEMARDRFRTGYAKYGSAMYSWSPERRLDETLQELADAVVYLTSGCS